MAGPHAAAGVGGKEGGAAVRAGRGRGGRSRREMVGVDVFIRICAD